MFSLDDVALVDGSCERVYPKWQRLVDFEQPNDLPFWDLFDRANGENQLWKRVTGENLDPSKGQVDHSTGLSSGHFLTTSSKHKRLLSTRPLQPNQPYCLSFSYYHSINESVHSSIRLSV